MTYEHTPTGEPWTIIIPFKGSPAAKSRLSVANGDFPSVAEDLRLRLAFAFLHDTVTAVLATASVGHIVGVSSDRLARNALQHVTFIDDPGQGLNAAITAGIAHAKSITPDAPTAVLTGDLPGLKPQDFDFALNRAALYPLAVVADHAGTGTTMITGLPGHQLIPRFGGSSHEKHQKAGHHSLALPSGSTLRQDVDTPLDLNRALNCGVGAATTAIIEMPEGRFGHIQHHAACFERIP